MGIMDSFNLQTFSQWIITGGVSLITIIVGLRYGLQELNQKFNTLSENLTTQFESLKQELSKLKTDMHEDNKVIAVQQFRLEKLEEQLTLLISNFQISPIDKGKR